MNEIKEFLLSVIGPVLIILIWVFVRSRIKSFRQSTYEYQNNTQDLLEEIRDELKKINKFNEDSKNSNYRL